MLCPHCGPKLERLEWLDRHARVTRRLTENVVRLCRVLPVKELDIRFAKNLAPYLRGIVASASWRLNTSVLEGINNRIKVIKRMPCGYRDDAGFFLKIRAAFPGLPR